MVVGVFFGLLSLLSVVLAWIDIRHGIIPDWLNLTIAALGLSKAVFAGGPLAGLEAVCEGTAIGAVFWLLRRLYTAFRKIQGEQCLPSRLGPGERCVEVHRPSADTAARERALEGIS
jgi:prepilin signal peptidase PulO-like enzyme (type II secretory pathway)